MSRLLCVAFLAVSGCLASESIGKDLADGGEAGTGTEAGETGTGETGTETGTEPGPCDPDAGDSTCVACQKHNCCPAWEACRLDDHCVCITVCYSEGHSLDACITNCGSDAGEHADLITCSEAHCPDECP